MSLYKHHLREQVEERTGGEDNQVGAWPCLGEKVHSLSITKLHSLWCLMLKPHPVAELTCASPLSPHPTLEKQNSLEIGFD